MKDGGHDGFPAPSNGRPPSPTPLGYRVLSGWGSVGVDVVMGWAQGEHNGKLVGYAVEDVCNRPDCETPIDRGLAYACGGRHGEDSGHCDGYFCAEHLYFSDEGFVCESCLTEVEELS